MTASKPPRRILLVLGMHRSGTSAAARVANLLGADLGKHLIAPGPDNPDGFWEHADAVKINEDLLGGLGRTWYDMREMPHGWMETDAAKGAFERIKALIERDFSSSALPAIKDPRMCLTAPMWIRAANALGLETDCLFVVRDPREVVDSLHVRNDWARRPLFLMWVQYLMAAEAATRDCRRTLVTYDEVLAAWRRTMRRVARELKLDWPVAPDAAAIGVDAFLQRGRRHHRAAPLDVGGGADSDMPELAARLYKACLDIASGGSWDSIAEKQEPFRSVAGLYEAHVGQLLKSRWDAEERAQSADHRLADERERAREMASVVTGVQDVLSEKLGGMGRQLVELQHELRDLNAGFQVKIEELRQTLETRESALQALSGELVRRESAIQALSADLAGKESAIQALSCELSGKDTTIQALADELAGKQSATEALSGELAGKESEIQALSAELTGKASDVQALSGELAEKQTTIQALSGELAGKESAIQGLSNELEGKASAVQALSDELTGKEAVIQMLSGELADKESVIHSLSAELADSKVRVEELMASTSWKITAPLRLLKMALSPHRWKVGSGRLAKSIYDRLPLSGANRLALKGVVFRTLAPLIRNTRSYLAWQAYKGQLVRARAGDDRPYGDQPAVAVNPDAQGASRLLEDLYAHSTSGFQSDYVAMDDTPADLSCVDVRAIAFYLPQFHPIPENDEWWGRGFTEWTNVSKAMPQFVGHYQPHLPGELGFYDLRVVDTMRRQVELARHYGLQGFCFHYYWFAGRRLLEKPIEQFLDNKDIDFPFCVCWANENWSRRWDGQDQDILMAQRHSAEDDIDFIVSLEPLLRDPRYIRVDGRPLIVLYRPSILPDAAATLERWRQHCRKVGIGELFLGMVQFDVEDPRLYGFDVAIEFPPHKLARDLEPINDRLQIVNPDYSGHVIDYAAVVERVRETATVDFPMVRGVFPGWDNEARKPGRGYTFANSTPARYREWLSLAVDYARERPVAGERVVFINAWNEWAEGAHLEPDRRYGYAYLAATRDAVVRDNSRTRQKLIVVSHDAHPHGAQYLSLNIARELREMGIDVECVLLGDGVLRSQFEALGKVTILDPAATPGEMAGVARALQSRGVTAAMANTAVSGKFARHLSEAGIEVVSLVHELPGVIRASGLQEHVEDIAASAKTVVFAAEAVRAGFESFSKLNPGQAVIRPQGLYKRNAARYRTAESRRDLRRKLGIAEDAKVVLCVGYADRRKGIDLFVEAGISLCEFNPDVHMVWVGHFDLEMENGIREKVDRAGCSGNFHFTGRQTETDLFYSGADLYALTSREDPYPSVVLEAFDAGLPVIGFEGCGGLDSLLRSHGVGLVPMGDTRALADACRALMCDEERRLSIGGRERMLVDSDYSFRSYVMDLLSMTSLAIPRVSVVVPNYNYARYLPERLRSIVAQTLPVYEMIVLDDASQDDSLDVLQRLEAELSIPVRVIPADVNSGSVFQQWKKGADLARGEYLWIAEADDLALPGFLQAVLPALLAESVVMSYCQSIQIDETGRILAGDYLDYVAEFNSERWRHAFKTDLADELAHGFAVKNTIPNVSAVVFRREVLARMLAEDIGYIQNFRIAGDWLAYLKVLEHGQLAFNPDALNLHRRHGGSVTLGGDSLPHLREVMQVQRHVRENYPVTDLAKASARLYADWLYEYFGLATGDAPELANHRDLRGLLQ